MLIFLIASMPFTLAQAEKKESGKEETEGFLSATVPESGEDFLEGQLSEVNIIVNRYEPTVLTSNILEEQNVPIYAFLSATPTSSTTLPRIQKVTITEVKGNKSSTAGVRYYEPRVWSWQDIGNIELRLRKIEKEHKVPDKVSVDLKARIEYEADVTSSLIGGAQIKILKETPITSLQDVIYDPNADILGGKGHIVLTQVTGNSASFRIYDSEGKFISQVPAYLGRDSAPVILVRGSTLPENQVRVRLNKIIDETENSANIIIDGLNHTFVRGTRVLDWKADQIIVKCETENTKLEECKEENKVKYILLIKEGTGERIIFDEKGFNLEKIKELNKKTINIDDKKLEDSFQKLQRDWGTNSRVEAIKEGKRARALFRTGGEGAIKEVQLGGVITNGPSECKSLNEQDKPPKNVCKLENILPGRVLVSHPDLVLVSGNKKCDIVTKILTLRNLDRRYLSEEVLLPTTTDFTDSVSSSFCMGGIVLESVEISKSVEVTLLSGFTRGVTETVFTLNIPIEKRAIKLSPRSLDKKINSTQELIDRLTKTIDKLEKVVETWAKVCLATTAVFTIWNFIFSSPQTPDTRTGTEKSIEDILEDSNIEPELELGVDEKPGFQIGEKCREESYKRIPFYDSKNKETRNIIFVKKGEKISATSFYIEKSDGCHAIPNMVIYAGSGEANKYNSKTGRIEPISRINLREGDIKTLIDEDQTNIAIIPINSESQLAAMSSVIAIQYREQWEQLHGTATGRYYLVYRENQRVDVRVAESTEIDLEYDKYIDSYIKGTDSGRVYLEIEQKVIRPLSLAQKRGDSELRLFGENYKLETTKKLRPSAIKCEEVLGPAQCQLMYNACDPVMCPASRCNLGGEYEVPDDNVIQSGLIGSLILCAPNFGEVAVPICISGVLASLKNIRSHLQAFKQCLITAKADDKVIGICDKIRSLFMCEIVWKEALTLLNARGGVLNFIVKKIGGGGSVSDYLGVKGRVENLKKTVDFFTNSYATTIFAAYKGKTTEQIGAEVCKSAIGGAFPNLGELVNEISQPEDPPQFTAYFEEHDYSPTLGKSRYNVFYHVYAGTPRQSSPQQIINYFVFLRKQGLQDIAIARGNLKAGEFADESKDFLAPQGYQEVCISINGKAQCGFGKIVSSSFGINKLANKYFAEDLANKVTKAEECVPSNKGGLASYGSGYIPTAAAERVCAASNPYLGLGKAKESEWYPIGECGTDRGSLGKCWEHANLERMYPSIQANVFKDSCEENQNAKLCEINQKCINGAIIGEFNIKAESPQIPFFKESVGSLGIRQCCSNKDGCEIIYPKLDQKIEEAINKFDDKQRKIAKVIFDAAKAGMSKEDFERILKNAGGHEAIEVLIEKKILDKDNTMYLLGLLRLRYTKDYQGTFDELNKITNEDLAKEGLTKEGLIILAEYYLDATSAENKEALLKDLSDLKDLNDLKNKIKDLIGGKTLTINPIQSQQQNQQQTKSSEKQKGSTENSKILKYSVRTSVYTLKFENNKWYVGDNSDTNYKKINELNDLENYRVVFALLITLLKDKDDLKSSVEIIKTHLTENPTSELSCFISTECTIVNPLDNIEQILTNIKR